MVGVGEFRVRFEKKTTKTEKIVNSNLVDSKGGCPDEFKLHQRTLNATKGNQYSTTAALPPVLLPYFSSLFVLLLAFLVSYS